MLPHHEHDPEYHRHHVRGNRKDQRNIIDEWLSVKRQRGETAEYVWNQTAFNKVNPDKIDALIGKANIFSI